MCAGTVVLTKNKKSGENISTKKKPKPSYQYNRQLVLYFARALLAFLVVRENNEKNCFLSGVFLNYSKQSPLVVFRFWFLLSYGKIKNIGKFEEEK